MKRITALMILSTLFLTACFRNNDTVEEDQLNGEDIFASAIQSGDLKLCGDIQDASKMEKCRNVIEGNKMATEAFENLDATRCAAIIDAEIKEVCKQMIEEALKSE